MHKVNVLQSLLVYILETLIENFEMVRKLGHNYGCVIFRCHFAGYERNCSKIFKHVITDNGDCCAFNLMPEAILYREEVRKKIRKTPHDCFNLF